MYNGGIFGGAPTGPLGVGVPSGWGNVDDTDENKDREPSKESDKTEKMRDNFLGWPQQLNLATWCATGGCGVTVDWGDFPPEVRSLLKFHVIFTIRRLLYEMGCALPDDTGFNQISNPHDLAAIDRIKREFNALTDFRNKRGPNGGLGDIYAQFFFSGRNSKVINLKSTTWSNSWPQNLIRFRDEGLSDFKIQRVIQYIKNSETRQEGWFMLRESYGLTMAGKGRLNRSIEAFVYCVLGAQVNMRSSITGQSGSAQEVKQEIINLFEKAIIEEELSVSAQRYQTAIQSSRAKLDFALAPGLWLLPSDLEINLTRKVGYNNFLRKATEDMKLGVNNVNSIILSKVKANEDKPTITIPTKVIKVKTTNDEQKKILETHNDNLATIAVVVGGLTWWVFR